MSSDPFYSANSRLARAKTHIVDLDGRIAAFLANKPYAFVVEPYAEGAIAVHKIQFTEPLPNGLDNIAADAVDNLRAALDNACYAIAAAAAGRHASTRTTALNSSYFPFADSAAQLDGVILRRCRNIPQDIVPLLRSFQPYRGGNDLLWSLNKLCNANKHCLLVPIAAEIGRMYIRRLVLQHVSPFVQPFQWDRDKRELIIAVGNAQSQIEYDLDPTFFIAFDEIGAVGGKPAVGVLDRLSREIAGILAALKAEARRLTIIP